MNTRAAFLVLVVALAPGCHGGDEDEMDTSSTVPVKVQAARRGGIRAIVEANGAVKPAPGAELDVVAPETARIAAMPAAAGDRVRKGELLVRFEIPALDAELARGDSDRRRAQARLENAKAAATRVEGLFERGIAARKEVEDARRELSDAQAEVAQAASALDAARRLEGRSSVRASFDGVVVARTHNPGDVVEAGSAEPILRVIDPARLLVEATVPVDELPRLAAGAHARIVGPPSYAPEDASLRVVPGAVDATTAIATVRLEFAKPTALPSGTPVRAEIVSVEHANAVLVRGTALVREGSDTFVYVVGADDLAHRTKVTAGIEGEGDVEILSGVAAGDRVVIEGATALPDGATVTIRE